MDMRARVNSKMPFQGKLYKAGEIIPEDIWMKASDTARGALVAQGLVTLLGGKDGDGRVSSHDGAIPSSTDATESAALHTRLDDIEAKQDAILANQALILKTLKVKPEAPKTTTRKTKAAVTQTAAG